MSIERLRASMRLAALLAFGAPLEAESEPRLAGVVRDAVGVAVAGASVHLQNAQRIDVAAAATDAEGRFRVQAPAGRYLLLVEAPGHSRHRQPIVLEEPGLDVEVDLQHL